MNYVKTIKENMISNINSARALIQADLDHARNVLQLWQDQVKELEGALEQLDAVDASRDVLRVEYQGQQGGNSMLNMDSTAAKDISPGKRAGVRGKQGETRSAAAQKTVSAKVPRKQRIAKESAGALSDIVGDTPKPKRRGPGKKQKASAVKYQDPASGKTWSGRGRKPNWLSGDTDQYLVSNLRVANGGNPDAAEPANQTEA
jgi:DNA-binding protein H-NS